MKLRRKKSTLVALASVVSIFVVIYLIYGIEPLEKIYRNGKLKLVGLLNFPIKNTSCSDIAIDGIKHANGERIEKILKEYCDTISLNLNKLGEKIRKDPWIKTIHIRREIVGSLHITIVEYVPFALLLDNKKDNRPKLVDELGEIIDIADKEIADFQNLLVIKFPNFDTGEIASLVNLLSIHSNVANALKSVERVGNRRWNLHLNADILVKMPEENGNIIAESWDILDNMLDIYGLTIGLREIDLRIEDRVFLKYDSNTSKELKRL